MDQGRIVHVIDPVSPGGGACTLRLVADVVQALAEHRHDVILIGHEQHARLAASCGLRIRGTIAAPGRAAWAARRSLRRVLRYLAGEAPIDAVQTWTVSSLLLSLGLLPRTPVHGYLPLGPADDLVPARLLAGRTRPASVAAATAWVAAECAPLLGCAVDQVAIEPPGIDMRSVLDDGTRRAALRGALAVAEDDVLVGLLSEPASWADAWPAANAIVRLRVMGRRARLVVPSPVRRRPGTESWLRDLAMRDAMIIDDLVLQPWAIMPALDAALVSSGPSLPAAELRPPGLSQWVLGTTRRRPCPGVLPLLWACAAGVPIVADDVPGVRAVLDEGVAGLLVTPGHFIGATDRLRRIIDDRTLHARLGGSGRLQAESSWGVDRFARAMAERWRGSIALTPAEAR